jgi:hypothetical protein
MQDEGASMSPPPPHEVRGMQDEGASMSPPHRPHPVYTEDDAVCDVRGSGLTGVDGSRGMQDDAQVYEHTQTPVHQDGARGTGVRGSRGYENTHKQKTPVHHGAATSVPGINVFCLTIRLMLMCSLSFLPPPPPPHQVRGTRAPTASILEEEQVSKMIARIKLNTT